MTNIVPNKLRSYLTSPEKRLTLFYLLAFLPFILMAYYYSKWPFSLVIPAYGYIILLIKKTRLNPHKTANNLQTLLGIAVIIFSFLVYYLVSPFYPGAAFYGGINYAVYIFGMFLLFFGFSEIHEIFSPVFLIVATVSTPFLLQALEPTLSPILVPNMAYFSASALKALGIQTTLSSSDLIVVETLRGPIPTSFIWGCTGIVSTLIFSIILVVILFEENIRLKSKVVWSAVGILGTFLLNFVRLIVVYLALYFWGTDATATVHNAAGYTLFTAWLAIFLYAFSKRETISKKIGVIQQKL